MKGSQVRQSSTCIRHHTYTRQVVHEHVDIEGSHAFKSSCCRCDSFGANKYALMQAQKRAAGQNSMGDTLCFSTAVVPQWLELQGEGKKPQRMYMYCNGRSNPQTVSFKNYNRRSLIKK